MVSNSPARGTRAAAAGDASQDRRDRCSAGCVQWKIKQTGVLGCPSTGLWTARVERVWRVYPWRRKRRPGDGMVAVVAFTRFGCCMTYNDTLKRMDRFCVLADVASFVYPPAVFGQFV